MKYRIIEGPESIQGSDDWKKFREGKISASMAPTIMGENPYETPLQLWERLMRGEEKEQTEAMKRGIELEEEARQAFNDRMNANYAPVVVQSNVYPWLICSLDGMDFKGDIIEIKCPGIKAHQTTLLKGVPAQYTAQLQHQMMVCGMPFLRFVSYHPDCDTPLVIWTYYQEIDYCDRLLEAEQAFLSCLRECTPPIPCDRDWLEITQPDLLALSQDYLQLKQTADWYKKGEEKMRQMILEQVTHSRTKIGDLKIQKIRSQGRIDYARLVKELNIDVEPYRTQGTECWRIDL